MHIGRADKPSRADEGFRSSIIGLRSGEVYQVDFLCVDLHPPPTVVIATVCYYQRVVLPLQGSENNLFRAAFHPHSVLNMHGEAGEVSNHHLSKQTLRGTDIVA